MVRKRRTDGPSGAEGSEGPQRTSPPQQQAAVTGGAGYQGGGGPQGGRGYAPQSGRGDYGGGRGDYGGGRGDYGGGRGAYGGGGRGGRGMPQQQYGGPPRGGPPQQQQQYGGPPEYQGRGRGPAQQQGGRGYGGGRGGYSGGVGAGAGHDVVSSYGGPPRQPSYPELHQAVPAPHQVPVLPPVAPHSEASSSQPPEVTEVEQDLGQLTIQSDETPAPPPPQSKSSLRFPLRPGKGSYGRKTLVKANHFFAELPKKDLHQYDVSSTILMILLVVYL